MNNDLIPELDTPFVFRRRPEAIPGDLRPVWRIGLVLLILQLTTRGGKSSLARLHVLNWALRSQEGQEALLSALNGSLDPGKIMVTVEPSLNWAIDYAHGEGLVKRDGGDRVILTKLGRQEAERILHHTELYVRERQFLKEVGKRVTEAFVTALFGG